MSDEPLRLPVFVFEGRKVTPLNELTDLEDVLDPETVQEGGYEAWDAAGRRLEMVSDGETVAITLPLGAVVDKAALEGKLKGSLKDSGLVNLTDLQVDLDRIVKDFREATDGLVNLTPVGRAMRDFWGKLKPGGSSDKA